MRLFSRRPPPPPRRRDGPTGRPPPPAADPLTPEDRPRGCGWFDSSHELQCGLRVTEHADADAVAQLVPLSWWLAWELDAVLVTTGPPRA